MKYLTFYFKNHGGGLFKKLCEAIRALAASGNEIHYFSTGPFPVEADNVHFHRVPFRQPAPRLSFLFAMGILPFKILALCRKERIDAMFFFGEINTWFALPAKKILKTKVFTFIRGHAKREAALNHPSAVIRKLITHMCRKGLSGSDLIIPVSETLKKELIKTSRIDPARITVLPNSIQAQDRNLREKKREAFRHKHGFTDTFVFGWAGTFKPVKRVDLLIRAFARIQETGNALVLKGKGSLENEIKTQASRVSRPGAVQFEHWAQDISEFLCGIDLLILPSEKEGCPSILLEAASWGTPSIGSDVEGIREILKNRELLFPANDAESLSDIMKKAGGRDRYYDEIRQLNRTVDERYMFNWEKQLVQLLKET